MLIDDIRYDNLMDLLDRFGGAAALKRECELRGIKINTAYISQVKQRTPSPSGSPRTMGKNLAKSISLGIGEDAGWMDSQHATGSASGEFSALTVSSEVTNNQDDLPRVHIPMYDIEASCGDGGLNQVEVIDGYFLAEKEFLGKLGIPTDNLKIITIRGDSMQPDLYSGDLALIHHVPVPVGKMHDGMFVIIIDDMLYIKRLQRLPKQKIRVISSNSDIYQPFSIDADDMKIIGQVVFAWCGKKF